MQDSLINQKISANKIQRKSRLLIGIHSGSKENTLFIALFRVYHKKALRIIFHLCVNRHIDY